MSVLLFKIRKYLIIFKFSARCCCTLPQLHISKENFICSLISMSSKPSMENPNHLIAFVILVTFLKLSPPFATCNSQLHHLPLFYFLPIFCRVTNDSTLNNNRHILCRCASLYAVHFSYEKQKVNQ